MSSASLAHKSKPEVGIYNFLDSPPPSHARASRRWHFDAVLICPPPSFAKWARDDISTLFSHPPPPSLARASRRWHFNTVLTPPPASLARASQRWLFDAVLMCKSKPEVMFLCRSRLLHLPRYKCDRLVNYYRVSRYTMPPPTSLASKSEPKCRGLTDYVTMTLQVSHHHQAFMAGVGAVSDMRLFEVPAKVPSLWGDLILD